MAFGGPLQRSGGGIMEGGRVHPDVTSQINSVRGRGMPLAPDLAEQIGSRLGDGFADVRVHTDGLSDALARSVQARAFTTGSDIFFAQGEYRPAVLLGPRAAGPRAHARRAAARRAGDGGDAGVRPGRRAGARGGAGGARGVAATEESVERWHCLRRHDGSSVAPDEVAGFAGKARRLSARAALVNCPQSPPPKGAGMPVTAVGSTPVRASHQPRRRKPRRRHRSRQARRRRRRTWRDPPHGAPAGIRHERAVHPGHPTADAGDRRSPRSPQGTDLDHPLGG